MPNDLPQWRRSISNCALAESGLFRDAGHDLQVLLRVASERTAEPTAAILDSRTLRSGATAGLFGSGSRWLQMVPVHFHDKIKPAGERQPAGLGVERGGLRPRARPHWQRMEWRGVPNSPPCNSCKDIQPVRITTSL